MTYQGSWLRLSEIAGLKAVDPVFKRPPIIMSTVLLLLLQMDPPHWYRGLQYKRVSEKEAATFILKLMSTIAPIM